MAISCRATVAADPMLGFVPGRIPPSSPFPELAALESAIERCGTHVSVGQVPSAGDRPLPVYQVALGDREG